VSVTETAIARKRRAVLPVELTRFPFRHSSAGGSSTGAMMRPPRGFLSHRSARGPPCCRPSSREWNTRSGIY